MQCSYVDILLSGVYCDGSATQLEPCVHQCADVLVPFATLSPQSVHCMKCASRHPKRAPDPVGVRLCALYLDLADSATFICNDRIKQLGAVYRKSQEREAITGKVP
jgi:hypothetical protein